MIKLVEHKYCAPMAMNSYTSNNFVNYGQALLVRNKLKMESPIGYQKPKLLLFVSCAHHRHGRMSDFRRRYWFTLCQTSRFYYIFARPYSLHYTCTLIPYDWSMVPQISDGHNASRTLTL